MSDTAEFVLKLADQVSGPAKKAADALRRVEERAQAAQQKGLDRFASAWDKIGRAADYAGMKQQRALGASFAKIGITADTAGRKQRDAFGGAWAKIGLAASRAQERSVSAQAIAHDKAAAAARRMGLAQMQAAKINGEIDKKRSFLGGLSAKLPFRSVGDYAQGAFFGELAANAAMKIGGAFVDGARAAVDFLIGGVKMAFVEGGKAENLRLSYRLLLGAQGGKAALGDISGFAGKTKYDDDKIAEMMRPLFNAGLRGKGARSAFAASGDLEAAGLGSAQEFIEQFAKIQLKGGVTEKLLVGMGVNLRDFKSALAKETGNIDKEAAFKLATEGKSDPQAIMNAIYSGIEKRQGGQIGTGTEAASKTMSARLEKLGDLPSQYLKKMSESPAWDKLSDKLGATLAGLDPDGPRGQKIIASLFRVFDQLATWIDRTLTPDNFDRFAAGASKAIDLLAMLPATLNSILKISEALATIWTGMKLVNGVSTIATAATAAMNAAGGAAAGSEAAAVAAAGGSSALTAAAAAIAIPAAALLLDGDKSNYVSPENKGKRAVDHGDGFITYEDAPTVPANKVSPAGRNVAINVTGDINVVAPPGADGKAMGGAVADGITHRLGSSGGLERAAAQGGG